MSKLLKNVRKNIKLFFCISLIILAILMFLWIILFKPQKNNRIYLYNTGYESKKMSFSNRIVQYIYPNEDSLSGFYIDLGSDSLIKNDFNLKIIDNKNKVYYDSNIYDYNSTMLYVNLGEISNAKNKVFKLYISCLKNCDLTAMTSRNISKKNHLYNYNDKTLNITVETKSFNNSYYWYVLMLMSLAILFFPFTRGDENEK